MKLALLTILLTASILSAGGKVTMKIYINAGETFAAVPVGSRDEFTAESLDELTPLLTETLSESLPEEVVVHAEEHISLITILRVVTVVEASSPQTRIRIVTSASYKGGPLLRELVVTPLKSKMPR